IAIGFVFYICQRLTHFAPAMMLTLGLLAMVLIIFSRSIKRRSILLERLFINNLRSRDIQAQVHGTRRPLYEGRLLDRDIHIADFDIPQNSSWVGKSLRELNLGRNYGVHVSSILRGSNRQNIPDGDARLFPMDRIQVIGSDEQLAVVAHAIEHDLVGEDPDIELREMKLRQLIVTAKSPFVGKTLQESGIRDHYNCMVVGIEEGKENLSLVRADRRFEQGDIIWVVGEQPDLNRLLSIT
ncbi:MAG: TrkA C-terminal domain-containing protein, partial [Prevotella sp.]|nr:TrkA C-terminal domain-containing protein [Prevotella sp.]